MIVNSDVDGYTKTRNHKTNYPKSPKKLLKTKRVLKPKNKPSGGPSFTFSLQEGTIRPSSCSR